ncbi:MAG: hypothetical protein SNG35_01025 [Rikenellaceae bacterium]
MESWLIVLGVSIGAVGLFVLGLSITLIVKGHFIDSEISTNKDMRKLGIKCAVQESRIDEQHVKCYEPTAGCHTSCAACDIEMKPNN